LTFILRAAAAAVALLCVVCPRFLGSDDDDATGNLIDLLSVDGVAIKEVGRAEFVEFGFDNGGCIFVCVAFFA